tara:strand:- start:1222 stop:1560 length:339 start_codon:yes stop_codon:yes gene_type:complete
MDTLTMKYIALALLGMLLHILMKIQERKDKTQKFSIKTFFADKMNWLRVVLVVISTATLMLMSDDLTDMFGIQLTDGSPAKSLFSFGAGYLNHSLIRNILKTFQKRAGIDTE